MPTSPLGRDDATVPDLTRLSPRIGVEVFGTSTELFVES